MKFKVGDRVVVVKPPTIAAQQQNPNGRRPQHRGSCGLLYEWDSDYEQVVGMTGPVTGVDNTNGDGAFTVAVVGTTMTYLGEWLEPSPGPVWIPKVGDRVVLVKPVGPTPHPTAGTFPWPPVGDLLLTSVGEVIHQDSHPMCYEFWHVRFPSHGQMMWCHQSWLRPEASGRPATATPTADPGPCRCDMLTIWKTGCVCGRMAYERSLRSPD